MFDKYKEYTHGVLDSCKECKDGIPQVKPHGKPGKVRGYVVECSSCGQCVGPEESSGMACVAWNKQQRKGV